MGVFSRAASRDVHMLEPAGGSTSMRYRFCKRCRENSVFGISADGDAEMTCGESVVVGAGTQDYPMLGDQVVPKIIRRWN